jgi:hypothetical protein
LIRPPDCIPDVVEAVAQHTHRALDITVVAFALAFAVTIAATAANVTAAIVVATAAATAPVVVIVISLTATITTVVGLASAGATNIFLSAVVADATALTRVASAKRVCLLNSLSSQPREMSTRCVQDSAPYPKVYKDELGLDQILFGLSPSLSFSNYASGGFGDLRFYLVKRAGRGESMN